MTTIRDDRIALFAKLQDPASQPQFWDRVADDVDWTVERTPWPGATTIRPRTASPTMFITH
jgi:hypothetical protein